MAEAPEFEMQVCLILRSHVRSVSGTTIPKRIWPHWLQPMGLGWREIIPSWMATRESHSSRRHCSCASTVIDYRQLLSTKFKLCYNWPQENLAKRNLPSGYGTTRNRQHENA